MSLRGFGVFLALLVVGGALMGCGRGALQSASSSSTAVAQAVPSSADLTLWFVQLSPAVKNFDAVADEVAQRVNAQIHQKIPTLRALLLSVSPGASAKELLKDVRVRLVITEKEHLTPSAAAPPAPKTTQKKPDTKKQKK
ncbi:MAG: hypothetical protein NZ610_00135 [Candidatus Bipolaricaulota bacterium]|nr:hypothetical protein [Candidatus Bipolaricaulota bacterium]MCS7273807.1 hypothetical protein [Candidatus Bipolaricaulota bacterium]MDW8110775.1 hypothetical protein [Candidatus Bipolaricaulota bacterium]MDW8328367.1 hypothetical protein [Candidatus Bipolaricaulota bacterium]